MKKTRATLAVTIAALSFVWSASAPAEVLVECGASSGKAFYPMNGGWVDDGISKGSVLITVDGDQPNVLFRDAGGKFIDAKADGGDVRFAHLDAKRGELGVIVSYPATGVMETFSVSRAKEGFQLLWTSTKTGKVSIPKVAAFVSACK